jgi:hypothetical protein
MPLNSAAFVVMVLIPASVKEGSSSTRAGLTGLWAAASAGGTFNKNLFCLIVDHSFICMIPV